MKKSRTVNKIIVTTNEWYTNEKFKRNGIRDIIESGYETELWNENRFIFQNVPDKPRDLYRGEVTVRNFRTREEFRGALKQCGKDVLILNFYADSSDTESICRERVRYCNIYGAPVLFLPALENLDYYYGTKQYTDAIKKFAGGKHPKARKMIEKLYFIKKKSIISKWPPVYNFIAAPAEYFPLCRMSPRGHIRLVHAFDYDQYLMDDSRNDRSGDHIVFIDSARGIHPEYVSAGITYVNEDIKKYRKKMMSLFDKLETRYHREVIIAAHPKAEYHGGEFGNRKIQQFRTYELIKHCLFAVQHGSTTTNMLALFDKPFLTVTDSMVNMDRQEQELLSAMKLYFGCIPLNLDEACEEPWNFIYYDHDRYQQFLKEFVIADKSDSRSYIRQVLDEIARL